MSKKPVFLFDIDSTLTVPRQPLTKKMVDVLKQCGSFHVAGGTSFDLLQDQFFKPLYEHGFSGELDAFVSNGAMHYRCNYNDGLSSKLLFAFDMREHLGDKNHDFLMNVFEDFLLLKQFQITHPLKICGDRIEERGSMVNICPIGRAMYEDEVVQLNRKKFIAFDKKHAYRENVIDYFNKKLARLIADYKLKIVLGGQTSFDVVIEGQDKTVAVQTLLKNGADKVIFIGDALFPGGNDACVREFVENWQGDIPCPVEVIQTNSVEHTIEILKNLNI